MWGVALHYLILKVVDIHGDLLVIPTEFCREIALETLR